MIFLSKIKEKFYLSLGPTERKFLNVEFEQLLSEVDRIANSTEFNRVPLLNGTGSVFDIQIGTRNDPLSDRLTLMLRQLM